MAQQAGDTRDETLWLRLAHAWVRLAEDVARREAETAVAPSTDDGAQIGDQEGCDVALDPLESEDITLEADEAVPLTDEHAGEQTALEPEPAGPQTRHVHALLAAL